MDDSAKVGDIWESNDGRRPGRSLRIVEIADQKAVCVDAVTGKRADIKLSRLNPHGGHRRVSTAPAATAPATPPVPGGIV